MKQEGNSISLCLHYRKSVILSHNLSHDAKLLIQAFTMQQPQNSPARQSLSQAPSERSGVGPAVPHIPGHGSEPTWTAPLCSACLLATGNWKATTNEEIWTIRGTGCRV